MCTPAPGRRPRGVGPTSPGHRRTARTPRCRTVAHGPGERFATQSAPMRPRAPTTRRGRRRCRRAPAPDRRRSRHGAADRPPTRVGGRVVSQRACGGEAVGVALGTWFEAGAAQDLRVPGRSPRATGEPAVLDAVDRHAELLLRGPADRSGHRGGALVREPRLGGVEQRASHIVVVGHVEEAEPTGGVTAPGDVRRDPPHRHSGTTRQQVGGVAPVEVGVPPGVEPPRLVGPDSRRPPIVVMVQQVRKIGEASELRLGLDGLDRHQRVAADAHRFRG